MCYDAGWTRMEKPIWGTVREVVSCELVNELGAGATGVYYNASVAYLAHPIPTVRET